MINILRPKYFIIGILFGFFTCCAAGYFVSKTARFHQFKRFYFQIQPQTHYYATANELLVTAKHEVSPDKILVLIGGNSVLKGFGQAVNRLWTDELQKQLGNKFKVLNYAIDGASITSFGGVAFRILSREYPKIIFVGTCIPGVAGPIEGFDPYRYLFWEAYYKNLLNLDATEKQKVQHLQKKQFHRSKEAEQHFLSILDSFFYFRNLWNWISYHAVVFTVWTQDTRSVFRPRKLYGDKQEFSLKEREKFTSDPFYFEEGKKHLESFIATFIDVSKKEIEINPEALVKLRNEYNEAFPTRYRSNILCVIPIGNPKLISALPLKSQQAFKLIINKSCLNLESLGYHAMDFGQGFTANDYLDECHLLESGGKKIAANVANKVKEIAISKGYFPDS